MEFLKIQTSPEDCTLGAQSCLLQAALSISSKFEAILDELFVVHLLLWDCGIFAFERIPSVAVVRDLLHVYLHVNIRILSEQASWQSTPFSTLCKRVTLGTRFHSLYALPSFCPWHTSSRMSSFDDKLEYRDLEDQEACQ